MQNKPEKTIQMVDLTTQHAKIRKEINTAIDEVITSSAFINGFAVKQFEKNLSEYLNCKHVVGCGNGTDALQIALMALDVEPDDEIITTAFTFVATAEVIKILRLKPVLIDPKPNTFNIDPEKIEEAITERTKAIIPVHLYGQAADMEKIMNIAKKHKLKVIEDNAQSLGGTYTFSDGTKKKLGTIGDIGCTSFFPSKNLGAMGDGGALMTNNTELSEKIVQIRNHGAAIKYYHDKIGVNSRLDSIQAAILDVKLKYLDNYIKARQTAARYYNTAFAELKDIETPYCEDFTEHVFHQYTLKLLKHDRNKLQTHLKENGIPSMVYYPVPLHLQKAYSEANTDKKLPVSEHLSKIVLSLPMHTELNTEQLFYITETIKKYVG